LEEENRQLKQLLAEKELDLLGLRTTLSKLTRPQQREAVAAMRTAGVSQRKACALIGVWRGTCRYQAKDNQEEALLRQRLRELAAACPRFGSPRLGALLRQELGVINHKRVEQLYAQEELQLPKRRKKPRRSWSRVMPVEVPTIPLQRWSLDFIHDSLRDGHRFRALTIVDDFSRECPAIAADTSISGQRVVRVLEELSQCTGLPQVLVLDNGPEFTSKAMLCWAEERGVKLHFESFNGKFRDECLNQHWFKGLEEAVRMIEEWRKDYNLARPHSSPATWPLRPSANSRNSHYPWYNFWGKVNPSCEVLIFPKSGAKNRGWPCIKKGPF
jgi:putative transposase